jgi:dipeptidase E
MNRYGGAVATTEVRVFLGGQGLGAVPSWLDELPRRPRRAALVPTAGNPLSATPWVDEVAAELATCGIHVERLDLEGAQQTDVTAALAHTDLVFVTGGHPVVLLEHAQRSGFARVVGEAVRSGEMAYAGMSAGAALAAPDLTLYRSPDDPGSVEVTDGLGLVRFFPLSHANRGRQERYAQLMAAYGDRYEFVPITDEQAVVVTGDSWQRRDSPITR